ncbi:MAG: hypothetical protein GF383_14865 [Candidatus Lokiarchaeota archaeon]|nr:hypothetical protein [Candidatus Lokiarchaeota archaeon]MBD3342697.1 hypothetical protein [Candidatus Lokiarchaeota archaeon]
MNEIESLSKKIIEIFGKNSYKKALDFPKNKITIIHFSENPIKINSIILDNDREFHLIIDQANKEIYHDCPSFLIHSEREKKICSHFIKLLLLLKKSVSLYILNNFSDYSLTSEDFGSTKKSSNFLMLADACFENENCIEGLSYLNKAIINQCDCENIIERFLEKAIANHLYLELFEFLEYGYENELTSYLDNFNKLIEKAFKKFLNSLPQYSFFNVLNIIESLNKIFEYNNLSFLTGANFIQKFKELVKSPNVNEKYFAILFIKKNYDKLIEINSQFENLLNQSYFKSSKQEFLNYFLDEIENLALIDKLKLMKSQFEILDIPKNRFYKEYKKYKSEIKELEKKVYLKKFAFLKLLIEKYGVTKTKGEFRKKRNTYIIKHSEENLNNPVYKYIISHIGFYGPEHKTIKSTDIGINHLIIKELFSDNLSNHPDIFYYKKQFWGDNSEDFRINVMDGFSLISKKMNYKYDIDKNYSNLKEIMIIEWDLAHKPRLGSIVSAYGSQIIIPDQNNFLFHDLKPFDLCYCNKTPVKIEGNIIKTVNIISKCSFRDAIESISKGMEYIEGYYPLSLVKSVLSKYVDPFKAYEVAASNPNKIFIPKYSEFLKIFREFLFDFINREKEYVFEQFKSNPEKRVNQILILLNLNKELEGLKLDFSEVFKDLILKTSNINEFKIKFLNKIHTTVKEIISKKEIGSTSAFNLKKLHNTSFFKYSNEIIKMRKKEFEKSKIKKIYSEGRLFYDLTEIFETYYGQKFSKILNINPNIPINPEKFKQFSNLASRLDLSINKSD